MSSRSKRKPIYFIKNHRVSYSHDPPTHSHLWLSGTNFLKLGSFPVLNPLLGTLQCFQEPSGYVQHSSLHGGSDPKERPLPSLAVIPLEPQTLNSLRIPRSGPFLSSRFPLTALHPGPWIQKSSICSSDRFSSGLDCSCQLQNSISHCL